MKRIERVFKNGLYRSRDGIILGVIKGLADYFNFSVFWARAIFVLLLLMSGFWPLAGIYFIAALLMKPEPVLPLRNEDEEEFYDSYLYSRKRAVERLKRRYQNLDGRIRRMEDAVTSRDFDWESRLNA
jgi:phage shock protein C